MKPNEIDTLLLSFCDEDNYRDYCQAPFEQGGKIYASDTINLLSVDKSLVEGEYKSLDFPLMDKVMPSDAPTCVILAKDVEAALKEITRDSCPDALNDGYETCYECHGCGEIELKHTDKRGREFVLQVECPVCQGNGSVKVGEGRFVVLTNGSNEFDLRFGSLMLLLDAMGVFGVDSAKVFSKGGLALRFDLTPQASVLIATNVIASKCDTPKIKLASIWI